ncbi:glutamate--tRNA ligase [bacterium]|jgi:glutamyl-tRNA synthetase|nr:glutamate--tRNA ligase [bacterium]
MTSSASDTIRVRFAPSPTGFLHIGGVRTALFNWLYARQHKGKFLLRIEDTDLERSEQRFTDDILASMTWLGLKWDEEIIYQSKRLDIYKQRAVELVEKGHAYWCYCSEADVEAMREKALAVGKKPQYDRRCRDKKHGAPAAGEPAVIRVKIPLEGHIEFEDLIRGPIRFENTDIDDFVIVRSNGAPIYNLSVVVDDVYQRVTHVVRGDDHINNTPKQIHLYHLLQFPVPKFAHLSMILGQDKKKLSKRHGAVSANLYRAEGFLPEALLNFLARLGWSHGDQEIFSIPEMIQFFSFEHVQKSSAVFNSEKLLWLNGEHIRKTDPARMAAIIAEDYGDFFREPAQISRVQTTLGAQLVGLIQQKVKLVKEVAEQLVPLCTPAPVEVDASGLKWNKDPNLKPVLQKAAQHACEAFAQKIAGAQPVSRSGADSVWGSSPSLGDAGLTHQDVNDLMKQISDLHGVKLGDLTQPLRLTVTGRMISAGLFELLCVLPWDIVEPRMQKVATLE